MENVMFVSITVPIHLMRKNLLKNETNTKEGLNNF